MQIGASIMTTKDNENFGKDTFIQIHILPIIALADNSYQ